MRGLRLCLGLAGLIALAASGVSAQPVGDPLIVSGTLVDERGAPAAGVEVVLRPYPSQYEVNLDLLGIADALPEAVDRARSGPDGAYSLSAPLPGPYRFEIRPSAPADQSGAVLPKVYGDLVPLQVSRVLEPNELPDRYDVAVRVLDADDQPVEGARVIAAPTAARSERRTRVASHEQPERLHPRFHPAAATTDATGIVRFLMPTAEAKIAVSAPGFTVARATTESGRTAFRLDRTGGIRFRVRGPDGEPAPWVLIRTSGASSVPLAVTDDSGVAVAGRLADASTEYEFERADHALARSTPTAQVTADPATGEPIVDVRLEDPLQIPGRVVDAASGFPIEGAAAWASASPGHNVLSDPNGVFDLTTRRARGATRVQVTAAGYVSAWVNSEAPERAGPAEVSVALKPAAPVAGLVTDAYDQPVAGANVWAEPRNLGPRASVASLRPLRATTADDGSFRLPDLVYGSPYRLTAQAQGFPSTAVDVPPIEPGVATQPVRIVLTKGRQAWGRVVDTDDGAVAGAEVKLRWLEDNERFLFRDRLDATEPTATDERGEFSFPAVSAGEYEVFLSHAEYVRHGNPRAEVPGGEGGIDLGVFTLVAGAKIHGLVTNPEREPVAGATIRARDLGSMDRDQERTATSDADGAFQLTGLPHELIDLQVRADGYTTLVLRGARPGTEEPIVIELKTGALLTGRVVDAAGTPAAGASVRLKPDDFTLMRGLDARDLRKRADGDGRFRFEHVGPGTWSLEANQGSATAKVDGIELQPGTQREVDLQLQTQDQLTVIVSTQLSEPVADARIRVTLEGAFLSTGYGTTDASGRAQIGVDTGTALVTVEHELYQDESTQVVLEPGSNELVVQVSPGGTIRGSVRSAAGAPLALATVKAQGEDSLNMPVAYRRYLNPPTETISDRSGQFQLTGLEPGKYFLAASAPGFAANGPAQPIEIDGQSVDGVDIVLEPGGSITGAVTGLDSTDLANVEISATRNAEWQVTAPDPEGAFAFENLAQGEWKIAARRGDDFGARSVERSVTIRSSTADVFVELPFERGLRLSGQILLAGEPMIGGYLGALQTGGEEFRWTQTDHRGQFEVEGLEPGAHRLRIRQRTGGTEHRSIDLQTDLEGLRIDLQPPATLVGVVVDGTTRQPLAGAWLTAGDAAQIAALVREDNTAALALGTAGNTSSYNGGRFELKLGPNVEQLWVTHDGYVGALLPLNIAPGQRQTGLVVELQPAPSEPPNP